MPGVFLLLSDPSLKVIRAYDIQMPGSEMANMGYAIIDQEGRLRARVVDPSFGQHYDRIIDTLKKT